MAIPGLSSKRAYGTKDRRSRESKVCLLCQLVEERPPQDVERDQAGDDCDCYQGEYQPKSISDFFGFEFRREALQPFFLFLGLSSSFEYAIQLLLWFHCHTPRSAGIVLETEVDLADR